MSEEDISRIISFYDSLTEEEWIAHDEYAYEREGYTDLIIPKELMPSVRTLIDRAERDRPDDADHPTPTEGNFPPGWNLERVQRLIAEMEEEEANWTEDDEAELQARMKGKTSVLVPDEIIPAIQALLARHEAETAATD